jgi:hypothetical protein
MDLIVCFDPPFWVGLILVDGDRRTEVFRHVFGTSEPTEPDVAGFTRDQLDRVLAGPAAAVLPLRDVRLPPTRAARLRQARAAVEVSPLTPELEAAMGDQRGVRKTTLRARARQEREAEAERDRERARARQREHHRHG